MGPTSEPRWGHAGKLFLIGLVIAFAVGAGAHLAYRVKVGPDEQGLFHDGLGRTLTWNDSGGGKGPSSTAHSAGGAWKMIDSLTLLFGAFGVLTLWLAAYDAIRVRRTERPPWSRPRRRGRD